MCGWGDFDIRPDLSHLPDFLLPKGSGITGCYETRRGVRGREGKGRERWEAKRSTESVRKIEKIEKSRAAFATH